MPRRSDKGRSYVCTDDVLVKAHSMHLDGMSAHQVADHFFDQCFSASRKALANAFLSAWRGRGWEIRGQREATVLRNRQRGFRPQCTHVFKHGPRKGSRCERNCVGNDRWCGKHHPARMAAAVAQLRARAAA